MSGHTPGPWVVNPDNDGSGFIVERANGKTIAIIYSDHEPDARLIALAPEMRDALGTLVDLLADASVHVEVDQQDPGVGERLQAAVGVARALLAKAEGRQ